MAKSFYYCKHCGNLVEMVIDRGVKLFCCGKPMTEILPNSTEAAHEKHIPEVVLAGNAVRVTVGSAEHPMVAEHYIEWIHLETQDGSQIRYLEPGEAPKAVFSLAAGETPVAVSAYCNLHGLWRKEV